MRIFDFVIYYLTVYFDRNRKLLSWSTPLERTCYAVGMATTGFLCAVVNALEFRVFNNKNNPYSIIFLFIALGLMKLFQYIYRDRDRYRYISLSDSKRPTTSYRTGVTISIIVIAICILSPFLSFILFVPFGSGKR
jgi:ABC-type Fe3+ transport system permease subunit